jgi:hypothetical protein
MQYFGVMKAPAAKREFLVLLAGILWSIVGSVLIVAGVSWLQKFNSLAVISVLAATVAGAAIAHFGFSPLARKNLARVYAQAPGKDKVCLFAFQNRRSYLLLGVMILLGYLLRHSFLPRAYLSPVYVAIGSALFLASLIYYRRLLS